MTVATTTPLPRLILDGRLVPAAVVAAAMAQRPLNLPPHRCVILVAEDFPVGRVAVEGAGSERLRLLSANTLIGAWLCVGDRLAPALCALPGGGLGWVGYGVLGEDGGWPWAKWPWPTEDFTQVTTSYLAPWLPSPTFPPETAWASPESSTAWIASVDLVLASLARLPSNGPWSLLDLAESLEQRRIPFVWRVWAGAVGPDVPGVLGPDMADGSGLAKMGESNLSLAAWATASSAPRAATVLAIVPHYRCEPWLRRCLASLVNQTRPPDGMVVVDDGSPVPPGEIVAEFPAVTLLTAPATVGPYRLVQQVIQDTHYDYYLFQDADDWSLTERLANLLATAEHTQADLIGTQELRWESAPGHLIPVHYPLDVNLALAEKPGHPLLHPTSLVRRQLVMHLGGFATGLRFGGDTEFLLRAAWVGRILNLPSYGYLRQKRPHSLTTDPHTGLDSPARQALLQALKQRAHQNRLAHRQGHPPDLTPLCQAPPIRLQHHSGPALA